MCRVTFWAVLLSCTLLSGVVSAQGPVRNWAASAAVSLGSVDDHCGGCPAPRLAPFDGWSVRAGVDRMVSASFRLGVEGMRWEGEYRDVHRRLTLLGPAAAWYPMGAGLRLDAGVAWFHYRSEALGADGVTFQGGLSWDFHLSRGLWIGPMVRYFRSAVGDASVDGQDVDLTIRPRMLDAGVRLAVRF